MHIKEKIENLSNFNTSRRTSSTGGFKGVWGKPSPPPLSASHKADWLTKPAMSTRWTTDSTGKLTAIDVIRAPLVQIDIFIASLLVQFVHVGSLFSIIFGPNHGPSPSPFFLLSPPHQVGHPSLHSSILSTLSLLHLSPLFPSAPFPPPSSLDLGVSLSDFFRFHIVVG